MSLQFGAPTRTFTARMTITSATVRQDFLNLFPYYTLWKQGPKSPHSDIATIEAEVNGDRLIFNRWVEFKQHLLRIAGGLSRLIPVDTEFRTLTADMMGDGERYNGSACCPVCLDEVHEGEMVGVLRCGHWLHKTCLEHRYGLQGTKRSLRNDAPCPCCLADVRDCVEIKVHKWAYIGGSDWFYKYREEQDDPAPSIMNTSTPTRLYLLIPQ